MVIKISTWLLTIFVILIIATENLKHLNCVLNRIQPMSSTLVCTKPPKQNRQAKTNCCDHSVSLYSHMRSDLLWLIRNQLCYLWTFLHNALLGTTPPKTFPHTPECNLSRFSLPEHYRKDQKVKEKVQDTRSKVIIHQTRILEWHKPYTNH